VVQFLLWFVGGMGLGYSLSQWRMWCANIRIQRWLEANALIEEEEK